jgi:glycosyltransferase involved in cell wall biosynthesis
MLHGASSVSCWEVGNPSWDCNRADEMKQPILSLVTATFNMGPCLMEGVVRLTRTGVNLAFFEHVVIDGASTDGSVDRLYSLASENPYLKFLSEPDNGQSQALNKGVRLSVGHWLGILNADDRYAPDLLQNLPHLLSEQSTLQIIAGNCRVEDAAGNLLHHNKPTRMSFEQLLAGYPYPWNPCAYFYTRDLHDKVGCYDEDDHYTMDLDFLLRAVQVANVRYVDRDFGTFVWSPDCKTARLQAAGGLDAKIAEVKNRYYQRCNPWQKAKVAFWQLFRRLEHKFGNAIR